MFGCVRDARGPFMRFFLNITDGYVHTSIMLKNRYQNLRIPGTVMTTEIS